MSSNNIVTEEKLTEFYEDIKPYLGCPAYVTQEGDAEYYSTDEKVIGRWTDNKPLYQRVFVGTTPNDSNWTDLITITNGNIVTAYLWVQTNDNTDVPNITLVSSSSQFFLQKTKLAFRGDIEGIRNKPYYVIVKYTKTTDSASTTIEQKPTHYSTEEQVVGTWIDGKPIYQKTLIATGTMSSGAELGTIDNLKRVIKLDGGFLDSNNSHGIFPWVYTNQFADVFVDSNNNKVTIVFNQTVKDPIVTVQYTKTTD